jgi:Leucine-rich repeat (LRR) protein
LRSNKIEKVENLEGCENLNFLTLSCNFINSAGIVNIREMKNLSELGLFGNYLGIYYLFIFFILGDQINDYLNHEMFLNFVNLLKSKIPNLKVMYLGGNYFSRVRNWKELMIEHLKNLKMIDGEIVVKN